jgi:hypothetical protein
MKRSHILIVVFVFIQSLTYSQNLTAVDSLVINFFKENKIMDKPIYEVNKKNGKIYQQSNFSLKKEEIKINDSVRLVLDIFEPHKSHSRAYLLVALLRNNRLIEDYFFLGNNSIEKDLLILSSKFEKSFNQINFISKKKILNLFSEL